MKNYSEIFVKLYRAKGDKNRLMIVTDIVKLDGIYITFNFRDKMF